MDSSSPLLIITARIGSNRFPGKVLKTIWRDYSILEFIIKRFRNVPEMSDLCLAVPDTPENDIVASVGLKAGIPVVRGPENDVVRRMSLCIRGRKKRYIGRITADNPLSDPFLLKKQLQQMEREQCDYSYCKTSPKGTGVDLWTVDCFQETIHHAEGSYEREHANAYVWNNDTHFKILWFEPVSISTNVLPSSVSIDTQEDFLRVKSFLHDHENALNWSCEAIQTSL